MPENQVSTEVKELSPSIGFFDLQGFELMLRISRCLSCMDCIPDRYRGDKGIPNCMIALDMSKRMNVGPLTIMQNLFVIYGNPGFYSKFVIGLVNHCGRFSPLSYETTCDNHMDKDFRIRAYATNLIDGKVKYGAWIDWNMVHGEGWLSKKDSKWKTMPEIMFQYRSAAFWQRVHAPDLTLGLPTVEDIIDMQPDENGTYSMQEQEQSASEKLKEKIKESKEKTSKKIKDLTEKQVQDSSEVVYEFPTPKGDAAPNKTVSELLSETDDPITHPDYSSQSVQSAVDQLLSGIDDNEVSYE